MATLTPSHSTDLGVSLFPLEFYLHVEETIDSMMTYPRAIEQVTDVKTVLTLFSQFVHMNYSRLYLFEAETERLQLKLGQSFSAEALSRGQYKIGEGITGAAFQEKQVLYVRDIDVEPRYLGRNFKACDLPYSKAGYLAVPFYGAKASGVLGFHLGQRSMVDIYAGTSIAYGIAEKIACGMLPIHFPYAQ